MQKLQEVFAGHERAFAVNEDGQRVEVVNIGNGSYLLEREASADLIEQIRKAEEEGRHHDAFELSLSTITFAVDFEMVEYHLNEDGYDVQASDSVWSPVVEVHSEGQKCEECGKEAELLEVAGEMLCLECISPPADAPRIVFVIDHEREEVASVIVPGSAINEQGDLRSEVEIEGL